jgi:hypothetical protein
VEFASWDPSEKEFLFARFKLFETFLGDDALRRNLHSQPFLVVDLSHYLIQDAKIDFVMLDVVLNLFLSYRADQRLIGESQCVLVPGYKFSDCVNQSVPVVTTIYPLIMSSSPPSGL